MDEEDKKRYKSITGAIIHLGQISCYNILFAVNQHARAMSKPSKASSYIATWPGPSTLITYTIEDGSSLQPTLTQTGAIILKMATQLFRLSLRLPMAPLASR